MYALPARTARAGASVYHRALVTFGVSAATRRLRNAGLILCYHNVVAAGDRRIGEPGLHMVQERFERHMRWLAARYEVVTLRAFVDRAASGAALRETAAVTFDDGYAGVFDHAAPILRACRVPATVFVVAEAVGAPRGFWWDRPGIAGSATPARRERWLTDLRGDGSAIAAESAVCGEADLPRSHRPAGWDTIRAWLGHGIELGVHSATHRCLPALRDGEFEREVADSRAIVYRATGVWPAFFAYPYGRSDARVQAAVRAGGYRAAFGLASGLNGARADLWCLRRINVPAEISDAALDAWTSGWNLRRTP